LGGAARAGGQHGEWQWLVACGQGDNDVCVGIGKRGGGIWSKREGGDLFKEQASISFLSWNSHNAPIFIVPSGITHRAI
jgi:hypothetical protein